MRRFAIFFAVMVCAIALLAQAPAKPNKIVIHAARLLDVKTGNVLTNQAIVIEDGKITQIMAAPEALHDPKRAGEAMPWGTGVSVVHIVSGTVLPGLIDVHTHLTMNPEFGLSRMTHSEARTALFGAHNAKTTLEAGFTSVRNVADEGHADIALRDAINAGDVIGPHMQASGPALGITGGHSDDNSFPFEWHQHGAAVADGIAAVQHQVRENIKYGSDLIKIMATGGVLSVGDDPRASQYTQEEMKAIVADAHRLGRKVAAHAHGGQGIIWASEAGVDSIEHGSYIDDAGIATLKKNGTYLVPTVYLSDWFLENAERIGTPAPLIAKAKDVMPAADHNLARAMAAGVKIAFGTDAAVFPHGLNARQFAKYVKMGMTPLATIQSGTVNAADLMGWSDRAGSIEVGKWADIIAVDGDPLQDVSTLEHVKFVMKSGTVYKNEGFPETK